MDREHFLDSQLWLHHVSNVTMEKVRSELNFYSVLPDAYCCFQVDKSLVFFSANQQEVAEGPIVPCDATQLRLQILISMDEKIPKKSDVNKQLIPGLYFILDGRFYLINHTLISKISFPQKTNGSTEPPSASIGWPGVQMRWWLGPSIPANIAVQRLSHAVGTMNKILLPLFVAHTSISEALSGRKRTRYSFPTPSYTPIVRDSIRNLQAVGASSSAIVVDTMNMQAGIISNMGCSNSSSSYRGPANANVDGSPRKQARISTAEYNAGRVANDTLGGPLFEAPDMSLLSCFNSWLNFIDKTSELVALEVTTASICDLFFKTKSADGRILRNFRSESDEAYGDSATSDTKKTSRMSKSTDNDIYLINGAENRSCSSFGEQTVGRTNVGNLNHNNANQLSIITGGQDSQSTAQKAAVMKSACNHVAASFINGLLTIDEALAAEELLEGRRAKMESKVQDLLHNLYSYPIGRGANNSMDAPDNKTSTAARTVRAMEVLLTEMALVSDDLAVLRSLPRASL